MPVVTGPSRLVREDSGQDPDLVRLLPLRGEARLPRPPPVELGLDVRRLQRDERRAAVDHASQRRPVALAEGGDAEQVAEGVVGHGAGSARVLRGTRGRVTHLTRHPSEAPDLVRGRSPRRAEDRLGRWRASDPRPLRRERPSPHQRPIRRAVPDRRRAASGMTSHAHRNRPPSITSTRPCQMSRRGASARLTPQRSARSTRATPPWDTITASRRSSATTGATRSASRA